MIVSVGYYDVILSVNSDTTRLCELPYKTHHLFRLNGVVENWTRQLLRVLYISSGTKLKLSEADMLRQNQTIWTQRKQTIEGGMIVYTYSATNSFLG